MKNRTKYLVVTVLVVVVSFVSLSSLKQNDRTFEIHKNLDIFYTLFRELDLFYVDTIDAEKIIHKGINEMLKDLDPYTTYIPESDLDDFSFMTTGKYGGIGSLIGQRDSVVIITDPYQGKPAQLAGLQAGDVFLEIDGKSALNKSVSDISGMLKGTPNTKVEIKVKRPYVKKPLKFEIVRDNISINPVAYYGMVDDEVGYISFSKFTDKGAQEVKKALEALKAQGATSLILDLRSNPGGILDEAVQITNLFVDKNNIVVSTKGKVQQWDKTYKTNRNPVDTVIPMAVLVNSGSASASEIVSGSLQDLDRAIIVGTRTFGKGLVQTTRNLSFNTKLKVTTAKYFIPSGRCIQAIDYSHRNEDGSVGKVPDSLITEFSTKNGRIVKDGGGIMPDVTLEYDRPGKVTIGLIRDYVVFDYASKYFAEHKEAPALETFKFTDSDYEDFKTFVNEKSFTYETRSEEKLKELLKTAKAEGYGDVAEDELNALQEKLAHNINKDLDMFKTEIVELIEQEIVKRYYYEHGEIQHLLKSDKWLNSTIELLKNQSEYKKLLAIKD